MSIKERFFPFGHLFRFGPMNLEDEHFPRSTVCISIFLVSLMNIVWMFGKDFVAFVLFKMIELIILFRRTYTKPRIDDFIRSSMYWINIRPKLLSSQIKSVANFKELPTVSIGYILFQMTHFYREFDETSLWQIASSKISRIIATISCEKSNYSQTATSKMAHILWFQMNWLQQNRQHWR